MHPESNTDVFGETKRRRRRLLPLDERLLAEKQAQVLSQIQCHFLNFIFVFISYHFIFHHISPHTLKAGPWHCWTETCRPAAVLMFAHTITQCCCSMSLYRWCRTLALKLWYEFSRISVLKRPTVDHIVWDTSDSCPRVSAEWIDPVASPHLHLQRLRVYSFSSGCTSWTRDRKSIRFDIDLSLTFLQALVKPLTPLWTHRERIDLT